MGYREPEAAVNGSYYQFEVSFVCKKLTWDAPACFDHGFLVYELSPLYYQEEEY